MRLFLLVLFAWGATGQLGWGVASANDQVAAITRFGKLPFDPTSVKVANFQRAGNQLQVTITFGILPTDSCMENYAGLMQLKPGAPNFEVLYSYAGQPCIPRIIPRRVPAKFLINVGKGGVPLTINGASYGFIPSADGSELEIQRISSGEDQGR